MADIELVVKVPEELYKEYVNVQLGRNSEKGFISNLLKIIKDGTPIADRCRECSRPKSVIERVEEELGIR